MKTVYQVTLHSTNLFFLVILGFVGIAALSDPSEGSVSPLNPVTIGIICFLLFLWLANYIFQIKKKEWKSLMIGHVAYVVTFVFVLLIVYPYLYSQISQ